MRSLRLFYDFSQFTDHIPDHGGNAFPEHPVKQTVEVFIKVLRKEPALLGADALHSLLAGMGHLVQRKEDIEITGEEFCHPVIDADQIPSFLRFRDLSVEGRQHTAEQFHVIGDDTEHLIANAWNSQWDCVLLGALFNHNVMCNLQSDQPIEKIANDLSVSKSTVNKDISSIKEGLKNALEKEGYKV